MRPRTAGVLRALQDSASSPPIYIRRLPARNMDSNAQATPLRRQRQSIAKRSTSAQPDPQEAVPTLSENNDSDDGLEVYIAKAALTTGTAAFESQQWMEAESLLEEARRVLETVPKQRRTFCDIFDLHFKMSVCTLYTGPCDSRGRAHKPESTRSNF